jgi:hypothetical protein
MVHLRLVAAIAAMLIALGLASPSLADSVAVVSIDPPSSSVNVGDNFALDVNISNVTDLYGFQFDLSLAPGVLSAVSITEGSFLAGGGATFFIPGTIDNTAGAIAFTANTLLGPGPGVGDSGTLAVLTVNGLSPGTSNIDLSNVILLDSNLNPISFDLQAGSITVAPVVATPEPSSLALLFAAAGILIFLRRR